MKTKNLLLAVLMIFTMAFGTITEARPHGKKASHSKSHKKSKKTAKYSKQKRNVASAKKKKNKSSKKKKKSRRY